MNHRAHLRLVTFVTSLLLAGAVIAAQSPAALVQQEVSAVLAILDDPSLDATQRRRRLGDNIAQRFDFEDMGRSILATRWEEASSSQREQFVSLFRLLLEDTYVSAIESRTTEVVRVGGERIRNGRATVIVTIERAKGSDIPLLFKLKPRGDGWIAYDANVEGLSIVRHYRDEFAQIAKNGGIGAVLEHLDAMF